MELRRCPLIHDAFLDFQTQLTPRGSWRYGSMDRTGRFRLAEVTSIYGGMPCHKPPVESGHYPVVCRIDHDHVASGDVWEPGYLRMTPAAVFHAEYCHSALRFVAPASGRYHLRLFAKTGALAFGGSECRLLGPDNRQLARHFLPKHFGHRWAHERTERLAAGESITFAVSPSPNGDAASDEVLVKWTIEELPTNWWPLSGAGAALLAGLWLWRRRVTGGALPPRPAKPASQLPVQQAERIDHY